MLRDDLAKVIFESCCLLLLQSDIGTVTSCLPALPGELFGGLRKVAAWLRFLPPSKCSQNLILHTHTHECPRSSTGIMCMAEPWASVGWEQVMSAGGLGHSPLHPVSSGRISSSPDMQGPWGRHEIVCVLVCCAQCCSSCPIYTRMTQTSAPRDSGMDVNGLGGSKMKTQIRVAGKEFLCSWE